MNKKKRLKAKVLLTTILLSLNLSCTTFDSYEQNQQRGRSGYVYKIPQQDRDAYEQEQRDREKYEQDRQQDRHADEQDRQRDSDKHEQNRQPDSIVYEYESEEVVGEVEEDMFPITRDMLRGNRGRPLDRSSFMITFSTILPFSLFTDSVTATSKVTSGRHTHRRRMRRHAATWNNPNSMIAKSSTADD